MTRPNYEERESFIYIFSSCQKWENMGRRNARINGGMGWGRELDLCTDLGGGRGRRGRCVFAPTVHTHICQIEMGGREGETILQLTRKSP